MVNNIEESKLKDLQDITKAETLNSKSRIKVVGKGLAFLVGIVVVVGGLLAWISPSTFNTIKDSLWSREDAKRIRSPNSTDQLSTLANSAQVTLDHFAAIQEKTETEIKKEKIEKYTNANGSQYTEDGVYRSDSFVTEENQDQVDEYKAILSQLVEEERDQQQYLETIGKAKVNSKGVNVNTTSTNLFSSMQYSSSYPEEKKIIMTAETIAEISRTRDEEIMSPDGVPLTPEDRTFISINQRLSDSAFGRIFDPLWEEYIESRETACVVSTGFELQKASKDPTCSLIILDTYDMPYSIDSDIMVDRFLTIIGHPIYKPEIKCEKAIRCFHVLNGGHLEIRSLRLGRGSGRWRQPLEPYPNPEPGVPGVDTTGEDPDRVFGDILEVRGGSAKVEAGGQANFYNIGFLSREDWYDITLFQDAYERVQEYEELRRLNVYGGSILVNGGIVNVVGCHFWSSLLAGTFFTEQVFGGDILLLAGDLNVVATIFQSSIFFGKGFGAGFNVAIFAGTGVFTGCTFNTVRILNFVQGAGLSVFVGGGVSIFVGTAFTNFIGANFAAGIGFSHFVGGGVMVAVGNAFVEYYGLLSLYGNSAYLAVGSGVLVQVGNSIVQANGPHDVFVSGTLGWVGSGVNIFIGSTVVFQQTTGIYSGLGDFYCGAGVNIIENTIFVFQNSVKYVALLGGIFFTGAGYTRFRNSIIVDQSAVGRIDGRGGIGWMGAGSYDISNILTVAQSVLFSVASSLSDFVANGVTFPARRNLLVEEGDEEKQQQQQSYINDSKFDENISSPSSSLASKSYIKMSNIRGGRYKNNNNYYDSNNDNNDNNHIDFDTYGFTEEKGQEQVNNILNSLGIQNWFKKLETSLMSSEKLRNLNNSLRIKQKQQQPEEVQQQQQQKSDFYDQNTCQVCDVSPDIVFEGIDEENCRIEEVCNSRNYSSNNNSNNNNDNNDNNHNNDNDSNNHNNNNNMKNNMNEDEYNDAVDLPSVSLMSFYLEASCESPTIKKNNNITKEEPPQQQKQQQKQEGEEQEQEQQQKRQQECLRSEKQVKEIIQQMVGATKDFKKAQISVVRQYDGDRYVSFHIYLSLFITSLFVMSLIHSVFIPMYLFLMSYSQCLYSICCRYPVEEAYTDLYEGDDHLSVVSLPTRSRRRRLSSSSSPSASTASSASLHEYFSERERERAEANNNQETDEESTCNIHDSFQVSITFLSVEDMRDTQALLYEDREATISTFMKLRKEQQEQAQGKFLSAYIQILSISVHTCPYLYLFT